MITGQENINALLANFARLTYRIALTNGDGGLAARSSCFLYQPDADKHPFVITAGHGTPEKGAFIETPIRTDNETLTINAGNFQIFYDGEGGITDYAYSVLPLDLIKRDTQGVPLVLETYQYKFIKADKKGLYGFAVINSYEMVRISSGYGLQNYFCYEIGLTLSDQNDYFNYFKLPANFKGDEYYEGASGAPIFDEEGAITSILVGGSEADGILKAFRLDNIELKYF